MEEQEQQQFENPSTVDLSSIFRKAYHVYRDNLPMMISLGLIYGFGSISDQILYQLFRLESTHIAFFLNTLITSWVSMALTYGVNELYRKREVTVQQALLSTGKNYWQYVLVSMLYLMVVFGGLILFILPGIYLMTLYLFADVCVVLERKTLVDAFARSSALVKFSFRHVLIFNLIMSMLYIIPFVAIKSEWSVGRAVTTVFIVFVVPFYIAGVVALYREYVKLTNLGSSFQEAS